MRVADDPLATPAQIERLAKKDLRAALLHPNVTLEFQLSHPNHLDVILGSPAWPLHCLAEPGLTSQFVTTVRLPLLREALRLLCRKMADSDTGRRRLIGWAVECVTQALPIWHTQRPKDSRPAQAKLAAKTWIGKDLQAGLLSFIADAADQARHDTYMEGHTVASWAARSASAVALAASEAQQASCSSPVIRPSYEFNTFEYTYEAARHAAEAISRNEPIQRMQLTAKQLARLERCEAGRVPWIERAILARQAETDRKKREEQTALPMPQETP